MALDALPTTRREAVCQNVCHFRAEVPGQCVSTEDCGNIQRQGDTAATFLPTPTIPGLLTDQRFHGAHIEDHCGVLMNEGERNVFGIQMRFDWI